MGDEETMNMLKDGRLFVGIGADAVQLASEPITISDKNPLFGTQEGKSESYKFPKSISLETTVSTPTTATSIDSWMRSLNCDRAQVNIIPDDRHLPRRMKKALRQGKRYQRDTRWKRKVARWLERNTVTFQGRMSHDDDGNLYIYSSSMPTDYNVPCLLTDPVYRMGIVWQQTAYNQPPHLGYYLPDAMLPQFCDKAEDAFIVGVGDSVHVNLLTRYTTAVLLQASFLPDGTRKSYGVPEGFERPSLDKTTKTLTLKGLPTTEGEYRFAFQLTGVNKEKGSDTLVVRAAQGPLYCERGSALKKDSGEVTLF